MDNLNNNPNNNPLNRDDRNYAVWIILAFIAAITVGFIWYFFKPTEAPAPVITEEPVNGVAEQVVEVETPTEVVTQATEPMLTQEVELAEVEAALAEATAMEALAEQKPEAAAAQEQAVVSTEASQATPAAPAAPGEAQPGVATQEASPTTEATTTEAPAATE